MMNLKMKKIIFVLCLLVAVVIVESKKKHASSPHAKRSKISSSMPSLGDSPEKNVEEAVSDDGDSSDDHQDHSKGSNKRGKISSENAANFGNNVKLKAGVNPSAAFMVKEENHKGFQGRDKVVHQKRIKAKKSNKKEKQQVKKSSKQGKDHDMMSRLKKIAKEIADVEHKKEEKAALDEASTKNNKQNNDKKKQKSKSALDKDISTENSHGRSKATLLSGKPNIEAFQCPWSCFWKCSSYCPAECCNNPYQCPLSCKAICAPQCKDKCCAPGAKKMPKLQLPLMQPSRNTAASNPTFTITKGNANPGKPLSTFPQFTSYGRDLSEKIKILKEQSNYAANLLQGFTGSNCPALCSNVCTPIVCRRSCCRPAPQLSQPVNQYATAMSPQRPSYPLYQQQRTYCPPICQSSCIEQCPNQCCASSLRPYL